MDAVMTPTDNATWIEESVHTIISSCNAWKVKYDLLSMTNVVDYPI